MENFFSPIARLPQVYHQAKMQQNRERTLAELANGGLDHSAAAQRLIAAGDMQGGLALANLANSNQDRTFRREEAWRAQSNADRAHAFQVAQSEAEAKGYELREVDGDNGKELWRIHKQTGVPERVQLPGGQGSQPNNPFMTGGAMNEGQSKDAGYASRMMQAEGVFRHGNLGASQANEGVQGGGYRQGGQIVPGPGAMGVEMAGTDAIQRKLSTVSDKTGYNVNSPQYQQFDQAQRNFINALLRRESGATIQPFEFDSANKQYLPIPGNDAAIIEQKRKNREEAIKGVGASGGKGYRPEYMFDPNGAIVRNPAGRRGQAAPDVPQSAPQPAPPQPAPQSGINRETVQAARANPQGAIEEARAAIASGRDRAAVIKRLQQLGIDPAGI